MSEENLVSRTENSATIYYKDKDAVFYNPVQEVCRIILQNLDTSIPQLIFLHATSFATDESGLIYMCDQGLSPNAEEGARGKVPEEEEEESWYVSK
tara:strand:+ start:551 stop:838 length:288 start_codon:yes stop_codon:yes gene_type:complete